MKNTKVFPEILLRIGCTPFDYLDNNFSKIVNCCNDIDANLIRISILTNELLDELHIFNNSNPDRKQQQLIQNYRRSLYNGKRDFKKNSILLSILPVALYTKIIAVDELREMEKNLLIQLKNQFLLSLKNEQKKLKEHSLNVLFKNGVFMSSDSLYSLLQKDQLTPRNLSKKEIFTDLGTLKYLSRSSAKTSPFSTFTAVNLSRVTRRDTKSFLEVNHKIFEVRTKLLLNNSLNQFYDTLLGSDKSLLIFLSVVINSSLQIESRHYKYVINSGNRDSFQVLDINPALELLLNEFSKKDTLKISYLINKLTSNFEFDKNTALEYLISCINAGFIELLKLSSGIDPQWNNEFLRNLKRNFQNRNIMSSDRLIEGMFFLNEVTKRKDMISVEEKKEIFRISKAKISAVSYHFVQNELRDESLILKNIFFEDAKSNVKIRFNENKINKIGKTLFELYSNLGFLDYRKREQLIMYSYFIRKYGSKREISFLTFYKDYYQDVKFAMKKNVKTGESNSSLDNSSSIINYNNLRAQWSECFINSVLNIEEHKINILKENITNANDLVGFQPMEKKKHSVGAFVQFGLNHQEGYISSDYVVLNSLFYGYGKMFSRFLHLFPSSVAKNFALNNEERQEDDVLLAEINDSSFHNANLHPPLLPYEIVFPGCHKRLEKERQILITDINIQIDKRTHSLGLTHAKSNKKIHPLDIGFQTSKGRSQMFQLMINFSDAEFNSNTTIISIINERIIKRHLQDQLIILPRITYEEQIVLQKKTWIIHKDILPKQDELSNEIYYLLIQRWKKSLGLPDRVFFRICSRRVVGDKIDSLNSKKNSHKPQFLDLNSPIFLLLFQKLIKKAQGFIEIEEMLPSPDGLVELNKEKYVTEFYMQIDNS